MYRIPTLEEDAKKFDFNMKTPEDVERITREYEKRAQWTDLTVDGRPEWVSNSGIKYFI